MKTYGLLIGNSLKQTLISNFLDEEDYFPSHLNYCSTTAYKSFISFYSRSFAVIVNPDTTFVKQWLQTIGLGKNFKKYYLEVKHTEGATKAEEFTRAVFLMLKRCFTLVQMPNEYTFLNVDSHKETATAIRELLSSKKYTKDLSDFQLDLLIKLIKDILLKFDQYAYKFLLKHEYNTKDGI